MVISGSCLSLCNLPRRIIACADYTGHLWKVRVCVVCNSHTFVSETNEFQHFQESTFQHLHVVIPPSISLSTRIQPAMDKLPLELLQRICSFFSDSPKSLKPIRLVSKKFAAAGALYLIPRVFLFRHPDSFAEVNAIANHAVFCKHVTTLIMNLSPLKDFDFED